ncbi:hypothetical protein IKG10_01305 [Candidatus Saccharibacteria bacterium]|nr:hypothetical protein [Candidatus Saccharibacteria bacterium]
MFSSISELITSLVIGWAIWPGSFFLVALIGESRVPSLWKNQSKAFFPGDLTLPVMWIAMLRLNFGENMLIGPLTSIISLIALFVIELVIFYVMTKVATEDRKNYPDRSANSPTKIYRDLIGYYIFPMSIAPHCIFYVASHVENRVWPSWSLLWVIVPLVFYVLCVIYDMRKGFTAEDLETRHPSDWKPVWETSAAVQKLMSARRISMSSKAFRYFEENPNMKIALAGILLIIGVILTSIIS